MNTKIKLFGLTLLTLAGLFVGGSIVSAQTVTTCNSVTFNGSVTPNGYPTTVWFEWGTNQSNVNGGAGTKTANQVFTSNSNFNQFVSGLVGGTTYYYRAMAQNSVGPATGLAISFNTPSCVAAPIVSTYSATSITATSAILNGAVLTNGGITETWFEWSTSQIAVIGGAGTRTTIQTFTSNSNVSQFILGLTGNTTYYYREVAQNSAGTAYGNVLSFSTIALPVVVTLPPGVITGVAI